MQRVTAAQRTMSHQLESKASMETEHRLIHLNVHTVALSTACSPLPCSPLPCAPLPCAPLPCHCCTQADNDDALAKGLLALHILTAGLQFLDLKESFWVEMVQGEEDKWVAAWGPPA